MIDSRAQTRLLLAVIFGFAAVVAGRMIALHLHETRDAIQRNARLEALKEQVRADPQNAELIERTRALDLELREAFFRTRRQFAVGYWLLVASLAALVWTLHRHAQLAGRRRPDPHDRRRRQSEAGAVARARAQARAAGVVGGALLLALGAIGWWGRGAPLGSPPVAPPPPEEPSPYREPWPCFRGPGNLGIVPAGAMVDYPTTWSVAENVNILWRTPIPAPGKSSPIVWGNRIFLTGGDATAHHVMCFDRRDGRLRWDTVLPPPAPPEVFEETGFAAPTPTTDGRRVYAMFPSGLLAALDFEGRPVWSVFLGKPQSQYGFASSLMLYGDTLLLQFDQGDDAEAGLSRLIGFDAATGRERWSTPRPVPNSWSSPALIEVEGRAELITCANPLVAAYDPASGALRWSATGLSGDVAPSPTFDGTRVIVANDSAQTMAIRPGGSGDVTATHVVWTCPDGTPDIPSPVSDGRSVLLVYSAGWLTCLDAQSGERRWEKMLETSFHASPILVGRAVYLCGLDGSTRIFELGDALRPIGRGEIGEPIHATPAFADGRIYIRGTTHLVAIGVEP